MALNVEIGRKRNEKNRIKYVVQTQINYSNGCGKQSTMSELWLFLFVALECLWYGKREKRKNVPVMFSFASM